MTTELVSRKIVLGAIAAFAVYTAALFVFPPMYFIEVLAALFLGTVAAGTVVYNRFLWHTFFSPQPMTSVRKMTLGIMCGWLANIVLAIYAVIDRAKINNQLSYEEAFISGSLMLALLSGFLQVAAPGCEEADMKAKDLRALYIGLIVGLIVAAIAIAMQRLGDA